MRRSLIHSGSDGLPGRIDHPFAGFRREMDRLFDETLGRSQVFGGGRHGGDLTPSLDVEETDTAVTVTVELPGVDEKDVELTLNRDVLTIKGEKKAESESEESGRRVVERSYGRFSRSLRLPAEIEPDKAEAKFEKGILTVILPKPAEAQAESRRIEIKTGG